MNIDHIKQFEEFHAHVYFDEATSSTARTLCESAGQTFDLTVGRHHEKTVGPHPRWSCQLAFSKTTLLPLMAWLENNRQGLTVFVHALSGNDYEDHTQLVAWLGTPVALNLDVFNKDKEA